MTLLFRESPKPSVLSKSLSLFCDQNKQTTNTQVSELKREREFISGTTTNNNMTAEQKKDAEQRKSHVCMHAWMLVWMDVEYR